MEGSGSVLVTNGSGCGSGRPKNIRIRIHKTGLLVYHDEGFEEAEGDVVMEEGEDETKKKEKPAKKKKKKDAVETAGGKSTSGAISKVRSALWIGIVLMPI